MISLQKRKNFGVRGTGFSLGLVGNDQQTSKMERANE
jgi:hypothetical protein